MLRAVLIGVGRHRSDGIRELTSATRDARALRAALLDANPDADITLRIDAEATCERVRSSIERTLEEAAPDDFVLITFFASPPWPRGRASRRRSALASP